MRLTFVQSERDNSTAWRLDESWEHLAAFLTSHRRLPSKGDLGIIFARFVDGPCRRRARTGKCTEHCPGVDHRIDENVEGVTALGLDFDDATREQLEHFITRLRTARLRHIWYTTWSSTPEHPKIRVVIALDAEVPRDQFRGFWDTVVDEFGIRDIVDTKCRNPGRLFFTPQCPVGEGATPSADAFDGDLLPTAAILARVTPDTQPVAANEDTTRGAASPGLLQHALTRLQQHGPAIAGSGGNAHTRAAWGILVNDLALTDTEARAVFRLWDLGNQPPWGDDAFAGPARSDQAWSSPRGTERDRFEAQQRTEDIFGEQPPRPEHPSISSCDVVALPQPPVRRYPTGMPLLDEKLGGGISTRQATVIMAPPADGKSALAVSLAIALCDRVPVLYASTELETLELMAREAAHLIDCPWRSIIDGNVERERFAGRLPARIHLLGCERLPMGEAALPVIESEAVRLSSLYGKPPLVIIDYLQDLARGADERGVRAKIGALATIVRAMSQRLDCAILAISSVSRSYYGMKRAAELRAAEDASVYLAAAKESGDVDYAAATVLFLDVVGAEPGAGYRCARIAVAKSRHGETGFVGARFFGASGRWQAAADEVVEAASKRDVAKRLAEHETSDLKVLAAITQAAQDGVYRKGDAWRTLVADVLQNGVREAIARLVAGGRLRLDEMHPVLHRKHGKGEFVIPVLTPVE